MWLVGVKLSFQACEDDDAGPHQETNKTRNATNPRGQFRGCGTQHSSMQKPGSPTARISEITKSNLYGMFSPWHFEAKTNKVGLHGKRWKWQRENGAQGRRCAVWSEFQCTITLAKTTATIHKNNLNWSVPKRDYARTLRAETIANSAGGTEQVSVVAQTSIGFLNTFFFPPNVFMASASSVNMSENVLQSGVID